jgi:type VI secretion system protein ImpE
MTPRELFQAGRLTPAIEAAVAEVKKHPTDTAHRGLLCELLCFAGDWERADKHLETILQQDPGTALGLSLFRQVIRAEVCRQQFYDEGRVPEFLGEPTPVLQLHLQASIAWRDGQPEEASRLLAQAEEQRPHPTGTCDGRPFDDFRDLDDLTAAFLEVLTSTGKYFWVPLERVQSMELHPPQRPRDLVWRRARMSVADGPDGEVFLPALYAGTPRSSDDQLRLGRGTDWQGEEGQPVRGLGQRTFLVGAEDRPILSVQQITFGD